MKLAELVRYAAERYHIREEHNWPMRPGLSGLRNPDTHHWAAFLIRYWDDRRGVEVECCDMKCGRQVLTTRHAGYLTFPFLQRGGNDWLGIRFEADTDPDMVYRLFDWAMLPESLQRVTVVVPPASRRRDMVVQDSAPGRGPGVGDLFLGGSIPEKIQQMIHLYRYGSSSLRSKCENFVRQARFMETYTDDQPWQGSFVKYFPTYHDMNIRQLRGYFTWRTELRKGHWQPVPLSMAYVYLYELLNGIGTTSPEDGLAKMEEFRKQFLDAGWGDALMGINLARWEIEFAVVHNLPPETIRRYGAPDFLKNDDRLASLQSPETVDDGDVAVALLHYGPAKTSSSPVWETKKGYHLLADAWRQGMQATGGKLFVDTFGKPVTTDWYPLANAVYLAGRPAADTYVLDPVRSFHYENGKWRMTRYEGLLFKKNYLHGFLHETDRQLRKYLKTKHYLRVKAEEAWASPYVEAAIRKDEAAEEEARRPKVHIDFSSLGQIRSDAIVTAESLLTEEEKAEAAAVPAVPSPVSAPPVASAIVEEKTAGEEPEAEESQGSLTPLQREILTKLLKGEPVDSLLKQHFLMPSIVADEINEALFDEIGDTVLTCDEDKLSIVEDYRGDVEELLK